MIYKCVRCSEPVSDEIEPALEKGVVILCQSCLLAQFTPFLLVDLTDYPSLVNINANELEAQLKEIEK